MSNINKAAVLNPFSELTTNILDYVPRATTSEFGIVAIGSGINVDALGRIYLDTEEYSDRLTAIEAQAASSLATQQTEVAAAIAQVNLTQSQTITALTLEVDNLKTNLTNRADQLAQNVTDITQQLTQDKAAFTQEIQDALVYLENEASVASALRTPRKIQSVDFDGTQDINLPVFTTELDGLVPKRVGVTNTKYLREDGTWVIPPNTTYPSLTQAIAEAGTATTANTISAQVLKAAIQYHTPTVTTITGNAGTATKLQTARTIGGVSFDGTANINLPGVNTAGNQSTSGNAATATKLANTRTISLTGGVTGSVSFDGSANASIATTITGLGTANGIATLDSNGQVPSTQLPSYVDDVLEYLNVAAFPTTGVAGKIYVETTGNTTYRWSGSAYLKITSGEVSSVAGKTGVVTLTKADVGLSNVDNTADSAKNVASAAKLATARTLSWTGDVTGSTSFDGTADKATTLTLAASGVTAGTYKSVTVDTKGRVTGGNEVVTGLVTATTATGVSNVATTNSNTYLNVTEKVGTAAATSTGTSTQIIGAGTVTVASDAAGKVTITGAQSITGNAATATKLQTARNFTLSKGATGSASFDGSDNANIDVTINSLGDITVFKETDTARTEYLELKTDGVNGSYVSTKASGAGTVRYLSLGAGSRTHMQLDPTGNIKLNPLGVDGLSTEIIGNFGSAGFQTLSLRALGTATGQACGLAFYPTFATGTDLGPRRAASISAGYSGGTRGKEYLDFNVGNATDTQNIPTRRMSIGANGVVNIGDGGTSQARLYIQSYSNGTTWGEREFIIENRTQDAAAMTFHAAARTSAAILKWNGVNGHFEFRNATDTAYAPIAASVYTNVSDYRLKNITGNVVNSGSFIDALKPRVGTWKADGSAFVGFVAHEVQEVSPSSVLGEKDKVDDNGKEVYQSVAYSSSEIIANLVAELQELRKRVKLLEESIN